MTLLKTVNKKHVYNVTFIHVISRVVISKAFINIVIVSFKVFRISKHFTARQSRFCTRFSISSKYNPLQAELNNCFGIGIGQLQ